MIPLIVLGAALTLAATYYYIFYMELKKRTEKEFFIEVNYDPIALPEQDQETFPDDAIGAADQVDYSDTDNIDWSNEEHTGY